jgi:hypothetical protein
MTDNAPDERVNRLVDAGQDCLRAANSLALILGGEMAMTKVTIENALRRYLEARTAWDAALSAISNND